MYASKPSNTNHNRLTYAPVAEQFRQLSAKQLTPVQLRTGAPKFAYKKVPSWVLVEGTY